MLVRLSALTVIPVLFVRQRDYLLRPDCAVEDTSVLEKAQLQLPLILELVEYVQGDIFAQLDHLLQEIVLLAHIVQQLNYQP